MGGGSATAKTASYVLVAADAGTTVAMNAAGATTITVNTGLFAAGDTVFIQNLGAGACTVTAGTATVATAGSLILPQNDAGILYFTATGASIFYDYIQAGAVSPLTTKGDVYTFSTSDARLGVGANNTVLTADSAEATGLKWATPSSGGMTLINSGGTTLTGSSVTISSIPGTYNNLQLWVNNFKPANDDEQLCLRFNSDSGSNRYRFDYANVLAATAFNNTKIELDIGVDNSVAENLYVFNIPNYANTTTMKFIDGISIANDNTTATNFNYVRNVGFYNQLSAISSITLFTATGGNFTSGTAYLYGVK